MEGDRKERRWSSPKHFQYRASLGQNMTAHAIALKYFKNKLQSISEHRNKIRTDIRTDKLRSI